MSSTSDKDFIVVKFVGLPGAYGHSRYKCIRKSWIVTRNGNNVMVACPPHDVVPLYTDSIKVTEVYSATLEYETDDVVDGLRFANQKAAAYKQGLLPTDRNKNTLTLRHISELL